MIAIIDWNPILLAFIAFLGTTVTAFIGYLTIKLSKVSKTMDDVHVLVNSQRGVTLLSLAKVTESKAVITKSPEDIEDAKKAMGDYLEHVAQQAKVDAKEEPKP